MLPDTLPEFTLGWGVLDWGSYYLNQPDQNKNYEQGDRWSYTDEQALFILHFYAVDGYGQWLYESAVLERPKGWGKSPLLAAMSATELLGPVQFSHWGKDKNGHTQAIGKPRLDACVQIAAISERQTNNTFKLLGEMLLGRAKNKYHLDLMLSQVTAPGGRIIERVTNSAKSTEGNRATFAVMDETHLWLPVDKGPELAEVIERNLTKKQGRSIQTTNAPVPGQNSVAEVSHDFYEQMQAGLIEEDFMRLLFDTREVHVKDIYGRAPDCTKEDVEAALRYVYGDAGDPETGWIDLPRIWRDIHKAGAKEYNSRRFFFNERVQGENAWMKKEQWDAAGIDTTLKKSDLITIGFKGATRNGAAAIVACRVSDMTLFNLGLWEKPSRIASSISWELPVHLVDVRMKKYLKQDRTRFVLADPQTVQDIVGRWAVKYPDKVEEFYTSGVAKMAKMVEQLEEAIWAQPPRAHHDKNKGLTKHALAAHTEEVTKGNVLRQDKPGSNHYIAAAQAACLALEAAEMARERGLLDPPPDNTLYGF